ncbi:MAG: hypothetical protein QNJ46_30225 [Leptolyngbyaceae cyanobacterium MO_188.B28]|nr:hypothetical protein [Leptolyngbyaceae cyanobacterium MO_188.B28]
MADIISSNFWIWAIAVIAILGIGVGSIAITYFRPLGTAIVFAAPIPSSSISLSSTAAEQFQQGCEAFQAGQYRRAINAFSQVLETAPACAEALHNRGRGQANLGDNNLSVRDLLAAGERYDKQGSKAGVDQVKGDMERIAAGVKA